nr:unnamed protein product [Digitaria exilis]
MAPPPPAAVVGVTYRPAPPLLVASGCRRLQHQTAGTTQGVSAAAPPEDGRIISVKKTKQGQQQAGEKDLYIYVDRADHGGGEELMPVGGEDGLLVELRRPRWLAGSLSDDWRERSEVEDDERWDWIYRRVSFSLPPCRPVMIARRVVAGWHGRRGLASLRLGALSLRFPAPALASVPVRCDQSVPSQGGSRSIAVVA